MTDPSDQLNEESAEVAQRLRDLLPPAKYCPVGPTPKQLAFLIAPETEVLYGGAAGGGKTVALAMCALQYVGVPGYNALVLRRTYTEGEQPDAIVDVLHKWLAGTDAHWDGDAHKYDFPAGAQVALGYLDNDDACRRYDGAQFTTIEFDELTHWPEHQYLYLFRRLRGAKQAGLPRRMRSATNPGGLGHEWVKKRFVKNASKDPDVFFIPAFLDENPYIDPDYRLSLERTDRITRARLLEGNWDIDDTVGFFSRSWFSREKGTLIDELPFNPQGVPSVRYWDFSGSLEGDWTVGTKVYMYRGRFYVSDIARFRGLPADREEKVKFCAAYDGPQTLVYIELEPGSAAVLQLDHFQRDVLPGFVVRGDRVTGKKHLRWQPVSAISEQGNVVLLLRPWTEPLLDELELLGTGAEPYDDQGDSLSGAIRKLSEAHMDAWLHLYSDIVERRFVSSLPAGYLQSVLPSKPKPLCQFCRLPIEDGEAFMQDGHLQRHADCKIALVQKKLSGALPQAA